MIDTYDRFIRAAAEKYLPGYDWRLYKAQLWQESKFVPSAVSPAGARGIAQFMPATWKEWAPKAGYPTAGPEDPEASIMTGACYMAYLLRSWHSPRPDADRWCLAMASYNAGLGNVLQAQKVAGMPLLYAEIVKGLPAVTGGKSRETIGYVKNIFSFWAKMITG